MNHAQLLQHFDTLAETPEAVAKVDELLRWCDALAAQLTAAQTAAATLLDANLRQILAAQELYAHRNR